MKTRILIWMIALALTGVIAAQQTDEDKRFTEQFDYSTAQALAAYPDYANPETAIYKKVVELDNALKLDDDPLYYSSDKPLVLARQAAKALGIPSVAPKTAPEAKAPEPSAPLPKFVTADQVKIMWVKRLPQPRTLDSNYHQIMRSYRDFVAEIKAGKRDLDAQETAATYNKSLAISSGNIEIANTFEAELVRIARSKSEAAALAQQQKKARRERADFMRLNSQLRSIDQNLRSIDSRISGW